MQVHLLTRDFPLIPYLPAQGSQLSPQRFLLALASVAGLGLDHLQLLLKEVDLLVQGDLGVGAGTTLSEGFQHGIIWEGGREVHN